VWLITGIRFILVTAHVPPGGERGGRITGYKGADCADMIPWEPMEIAAAPNLKEEA
jgi:hypothetical protein